MKGLPPIRREDVAVSVPLVALYPSLGDGRVDTPLKVAVPHLKELMPPENARDRDFVLGEHCKNLTCSEVSIKFWNCHRYPPFARHHKRANASCQHPVALSPMLSGVLLDR